VVAEKSIGGDAPKLFIKLHEHGKCRKKNIRKWPSFICKIGHKWYPNESVTELFLTRIGQVLDLEMADARLQIMNGQLCFLSRYFLKKDESLIHGAEVYSAYLEDENFVKTVETLGKENRFFTFQEACSAIESQFSSCSQDILESLVKMLVFDALVGNNDRHFYNRGIVVGTLPKSKPKFAPIYDSARGLYWNESEHKIKRRINKQKNGRVVLDIDGYLHHAKPKMGWDGAENLNHFEFVEKLCAESDRFKEIAGHLSREAYLSAVLALIEKEFSSLFSANRKLLLKETLIRRFRTVHALTLRSYGH
jgi:hypothetical protein